MNESDLYADRIEELKTAQYEINGLTSPLAMEDPELEWYQARAQRNARELRILTDHGDELRRLDHCIAREDAVIDQEYTRRAVAAIRLRKVRTWSAATAGLMVLLAMWGVALPWTPLAVFALVIGSAMAWRRLAIMITSPSMVLDEHDRAVYEFTCQREAILAEAGQSPSASSPDSAQERSSGYADATAELSDSSWS